MLYKNKIKVQNILKSAVALMLMLTLSLSTALSPLAKAEEAKYTWKKLTSMPVSNGFKDVYITPDGSKLFVLETDTANNTNLWMSADDGATWRKIFSKQTTAGIILSSTDGSKIILTSPERRYLYISTDGGQNFTDRTGALPLAYKLTTISPDGSFLVGCEHDGRGSYTTHISTDDGQTWTRKGTSNVTCANEVFNNGILMTTRSPISIVKSTDYGQTWTKITDFSPSAFSQSISNNGNNIFVGDRISLDGGNHWTPSSAPIPTDHTVYQTGISDDGKKLFVVTKAATGAATNLTLLTSTDGGRTWHTDAVDGDGYMIVSRDMSKMFYSRLDNSNYSFFARTLTTPQPVTPGSGAGGTVTPSTGSTSAAPNQKPGKASGRLAETGTSTWMVGGLAVVAVAAGALVLRKRL